MGPLIFVVILFLFAWLFLVLPSRRRARQHKAMQDSVEVGDEIISAGGIHGVVSEVDDEEVWFEIAEGVVVELDRRAIAAVARDLPSGDDDAEEDEAEEDEEELDEPDEADQREFEDPEAESGIRD
jgi:preprotein translocase subunit YajC